MEIFGGMPDAVKFVIVFVVILAILVPLLWRRFNVGPLSSAGQRGRRLAVIDTTAVDVRRKLVLIRRDNVEHLLMIGGPTDIVVEPNITRTAAAVQPRPIPDARSEAARQAAVTEAPDWSLPLEPMARPVRTVDLDAALPLPEPPARTAREAMVDSMRAVRSGAAARRGLPTDFDNPPEEIAAPALTPPPAPAEVHQRPPQAPEVRPEPRLDPRRPAASAPAQEAQRLQPSPEPPLLPPSFAPPSGDTPEPKRERAAPAAPRPAQPSPAATAAPAAVPPSPRPVQPVPAAANAQASPPRPVQPVPAAAASAAPVPPPRPTPSDESNLAEMAQRLEAALRRPTTRPEPPPPPPVRQQRPEPPAGRKPVYPDAAGPAKVGVKSPESPQPDLKVLSGKGKGESSMDSLEDEMAKMLGRPGKS